MSSSASPSAPAPAQDQAIVPVTTSETGSDDLVPQAVSIEKENSTNLTHKMDDTPPVTTTKATSAPSNKNNENDKSNKPIVAIKAEGYDVKAEFTSINVALPIQTSTKGPVESDVADSTAAALSSANKLDSSSGKNVKNIKNVKKAKNINLNERKQKNSIKKNEPQPSQVKSSTTDSKITTPTTGDKSSTSRKVSESTNSKSSTPTSTSPMKESKKTISIVNKKEKASSSSSSTPNTNKQQSSSSSAAASTASSTTASRKKKQEKTKKPGKKRKASNDATSSSSRRGSGSDSQSHVDDVTKLKKTGTKKAKKKKKTSENDNDSSSVRAAKSSTAKVKKSKSKKVPLLGLGLNKFSPAQKAMNDLKNQILEEDKYSQKGSVVETDSSDDEDDERTIVAINSGASASKRGSYGAESHISKLQLDRATITRAMRKRLRIEELRGVIDTSGVNKKRPNSVVLVEEHNDAAMDASGDDDAKVMDGDPSGRGGRKKKRKKNKRNGRPGGAEVSSGVSIGGSNVQVTQDLGIDKDEDGNKINDLDVDESSIFGQTTGSSNATWVECDKCKKWRRLRGVVDAKKLPVKWFCSMNKKDPERSKCSAPEEEYEATNTPENVTDQRTRKHLRLWVRRLQCNENFEARLPTMTRGKKRNTTSAKEPYEWIRCCNPSCGKWRALLRSMDAASVIDAAKNGEWYCVLNTWDEKTASCAAPQENLPAIGCPQWVMKNDN